jgi:hypothetical protein
MQELAIKMQFRAHGAMSLARAVSGWPSCSQALARRQHDHGGPRRVVTMARSDRSAWVFDPFRKRNARR